jgi:hypothetical protein
MVWFAILKLYGVNLGLGNLNLNLNYFIMIYHIVFHPFIDDVEDPSLIACAFYNYWIVSTSIFFNLCSFS